MGAAHKQGTVGHRMTPDVATVGMEATAAEALHLVRGGRHFKITDPVFILDEGEKLVGYLPLVELLRAEGSARVGTIMRKQPASLPPEADEERIAHVALKHGLTAVPVAEKGRLLGAVDSRDVLHILNRSLQEDILHFAGIHKSHLQYENTLAVPLHVTLLHRLPWLVVGLVGIIHRPRHRRLHAHRPPRDWLHVPRDDAPAPQARPGPCAGKRPLRDDCL